MMPPPLCMRIYYVLDVRSNARYFAVPRDRLLVGNLCESMCPADTFALVVVSRWRRRVAVHVTPCAIVASAVPAALVFVVLAVLAVLVVLEVAILILISFLPPSLFPFFFFFFGLVVPRGNKWRLQSGSDVGGPEGVRHMRIPTTHTPPPHAPSKRNKECLETAVPRSALCSVIGAPWWLPATPSPTSRHAMAPARPQRKTGMFFLS